MSVFNSSAVWYRSTGSGASSFRMIASTAGVTSGLRARSAGGPARRAATCAVMSRHSFTEDANGTAPVSIS